LTQCRRFDELFASETTLAGLSYLKQIREWKILGYQVSLYFLTLPSAEAAIDRVAERVKQGGHNIPQDVIRRRFTSGKRNFDTHYKFVVDSWACYDNAAPEPVLLEWSERT
jgi:predicted ABC-type ATPase